jgi:hypothetical protein
MRGNHRFSVLLLIFSFLTIAFLGFQFLRFAEAKTSSVALPPLSLTIVGANGTQVVLDETGVAGLPYYRGYGGFKKQTGNIEGLGNYTGVSLNTLCSLVGGLTNTSVVKVIATDNYTQTFTYAQVNGNFVTYNPVTGLEVSHSQPLVPLVAYYFDDVNISESNGGPLRLAIVGPEGLVTDSAYWVKWVVKVEVIGEAVPEFPSPMVLPALFLMIFVTAVCLKFRYRQRRDHVKQFEKVAVGQGEMHGG